jgi:hypothetical protein
MSYFFISFCYYIYIFYVSFRYYDNKQILFFYSSKKAVKIWHSMTLEVKPNDDNI